MLAASVVTDATASFELSICSVDPPLASGSGMDSPCGGPLRKDIVSASMTVRAEAIVVVDIAASAHAIAQTARESAQILPRDRTETCNSAAEWPPRRT